MIRDVEQRIVTLRNEVRAMKTARELTYSQLLKPGNAPTRSLSGSMACDDTKDVLMRTRARFRRTDGVRQAPLVDFALDFRFSPTYAEHFQQLWGETLQMDDIEYYDEYYSSGYVGDVGNDYVDYYIEVPVEIIRDFGSIDSIGFNLTVSAIAMVPGELTIERLI